MATPLLSVVIPTHGRPQYLLRAIDSALQSAPDGDVEVIVVPNGPDRSWQELGSGLLQHSRVKVLPIETAHANAARNHGLAHASGKYLRFLDDDDMLFADGARKQIEMLDMQSGEVCSGRVRHIGPDGTTLGRVGHADTHDFVCAALSVSGFRLPTSNVFLRDSLATAVWDESVPRAQDYVWMIALAGIREWRWLDLDLDVGGWVHHTGARISSSAADQALPFWVFDAITALYRNLALNDRLSAARRTALASAIWVLVHNFFPRYPLRCHSYAIQAQLIDAESRPPGTESIVSGMPPLLLEWLMLPKRFGNHLVHRAREKSNGNEVMREL